MDLTELKSIQQGSLHPSDFSSNSNNDYPNKNIDIKIMPLSYDPNRACFNPQYYRNFGYIFNTTPIPRPNIYYNIGKKLSLELPNSDLTIPFKNEKYSDFNFINPFVSDNYLSNIRNDFIPFTYSFPNSKIERLNTIPAEYTRELKNVADSQESISKLKPTQIRFDRSSNIIDTIPNETTTAIHFTKSGFSEQQSADAKKKQKTETESTEHRSAFRNEKTEEIDVDTRQKKKVNKREERPLALRSHLTNIYPLPKITYGQTEKTQPNCIYDKKKTFIYN
ncbi:hypothetical protein PGB90_010435 [Kerria lacca]